MLNLILYHWRSFHLWLICRRLTRNHEHYRRLAEANTLRLTGRRTL